MASAASPQTKWQRLFGALDLVSEGTLYTLIPHLGQVIPPTERQSTGARLVEMLETAGSSTSPICGVLKQIGYRAGVPALISIMEYAVPWKGTLIAEVLASWRVIDAVPAIRQSIENARYSNDHNVAQLAKHLYALDGAVSSVYLADLLKDAVPALQRYLIDALADVNDSAFIDVVSELAGSSLDGEVRTKAQAFLQKHVSHKPM